MPGLSALFVAPDSVYKRLGVDSWDAARNAFTWPGGNPLIAHPPCQQWSRLRRFARRDLTSRSAAPYCIDLVRTWGGVVEHPAGSYLWPYLGLPRGHTADIYGGWTLTLDQFLFGHKARKSTWFYIVGCDPRSIPPFPLSLAKPLVTVPDLSRSERDATPIDLAHWLIALALSTRRVPPCGCAAVDPPVGN